MTDTSLFERRFDPLMQAAGCLGGVLLVNLIWLAFNSLDAGETPSRFPWLSVTAFMLFFAIFNAVFSYASERQMRYWGRSIYGYMGLAGIGGLMAWLFTGLTIFEAGSYSWIYIVVTIGYIVFLTMITVMRKVVEFAQKEEWNQPKFRQKKRKR